MPSYYECNQNPTVRKVSPKICFHFSLHVLSAHICFFFFFLNSAEGLTKTTFISISSCRHGGFVAQLTFVEYFEAHIGAAVISGEQKIKEVAAAEQELGHLGTVEGANQRRKEVWAVVDLEEVITQLSLEPGSRKHPMIMISLNKQF